MDYRYDTSGIRFIAIDTTESIPSTPTFDTAANGRTEYLIDHNNFTGYDRTIIETKYNGSGNLIERTSYIFGTDEITQTVSTYHPTTGVLQTTATHVFGHDGHGSVRALYAASAAFAQVFTYTANGEPLAIHYATAGFVSSDAASALTKLLYNGEGLDTRTGLYNFRARWYSASNARFERLDPFAGNPNDPFSFNKYGFVHGNPVMATDPSGNMIAMMLSVGMRLGGLGRSMATQAIAGGVLGAIVGYAIGYGDALIEFEDFEAAKALAAVASQMGAELGAAFGATGAVFKVAKLCSLFAVGTVTFGGFMTGNGMADALSKGNVPLFLYRSITGLLGTYMAIRASAACFPAGTKVRTNSGTKNIEDICADELVLSRHDAQPTSANDLRRVSLVFQKTEGIFEVGLSEGIVHTTGSHPFYVQGIGWISASELSKDSHVMTESNEWARVEYVRDTGCSETIYGMTVEEFSTYFVVPKGNSKNSIWVHNWCKETSVAKTTTSQTTTMTAADEAAIAAGLAEIAPYANKPNASGPLSSTIMNGKDGNPVPGGRGAGVARKDVGTEQVADKFFSMYNTSFDYVKGWLSSNQHAEAKGFARAAIGVEHIGKVHSMDIVVTRWPIKGMCPKCNDAVHKIVQQTGIKANVYEQFADGTWIKTVITPQ